MLDYRVKTFLTVCKTMNYTKAADILHLTQPGVSQHIAYLEKFYGTALFRYENKVLLLTKAGETLQKRLNVLNNDEAQLLNELSNFDDDNERFCLGVTMTVGEYAIIKPISVFIKNNPQITVNIRFGNTTDLLQMLQNGEINMALVEGYYPKDEFEHRNFSIEKYIPVCSVNHTFVCGEPKVLNDLVGERLLIREKGSGTRNILERAFALKGMNVSNFRYLTELENMHTIIALMQQDCGISFLYQIAVEEQLQKKVLKEIALEDFNIEHEFDFIWEKGSLYSEKYLSYCQELINMNLIR